MRKLEKMNENTFVLKTEDEKARLRTEKEYSKQELKDIHRSLEMQKNQASMQRQKVEKDIEKLGDLDDPEIEALADKLEKAQKFLQKKKLLAQLEIVNKDIEDTDKQLAEIKGAIPEIDRLPKKK